VVDRRKVAPVFEIFLAVQSNLVLSDRSMNVGVLSILSPENRLAMSSTGVLGKPRRR